MNNFFRQLALLSILLYGAAVHANNFVVCKSTYALCTTATCTVLDEKTKMATCHCDVKTGYSASEKKCQEPQKTAQGIQLDSRYYPVRQYKVCSNANLWAYCLDAPCIKDPNDPTKANCRCKVVKNKGDYVIVTINHKNPGCDAGIISSATVEQIMDITQFLKSSTTLKPFDIEVIPNTPHHPE